MPVRAIIFDFNGVIADDETPHLLCFQQALEAFGMSLSQEDYYGRYLGMDERTCTESLLTLQFGRCDPAIHARIMQRKADLFSDVMAQHKPALFPGVIEFVKLAKTNHQLAIASGGRRTQIDATLQDTPIEKDFAVIVSADDVPSGKPDPAIYDYTLRMLNAKTPRPPLIRASECLVIEDTRAGIQSGLKAGMQVVALATTYPDNQLGDAHLVLPNLSGVSPDWIKRRLAVLSSRTEGEDCGV